MRTTVCVRCVDYALGHRYVHSPNGSLAFTGQVRARLTIRAQQRERQRGGGGGTVTLRSATGGALRWGLADSSECPRRERGVPFPSPLPAALDPAHTHTRAHASSLRLSFSLPARRLVVHDFTDTSAADVHRRSSRNGWNGRFWNARARSRCVFFEYAARDRSPRAADREGQLRAPSTIFPVTARDGHSRQRYALKRARMYVRAPARPLVRSYVCASPPSLRRRGKP